MRVLHILDHSLPVQDGYAYRTINLMRAQQNAGFTVAGLTTQRQYDSDTSPATELYTTHGIPFYRTEKASFTLPSGLREPAEMLATYRRLMEVIDVFKPDVLHAHSPVLNILPALAIRAVRDRNIRVVYEIRAFWEDAAVDMGHTTQGSKRYRLTRWLETRACQNVDAVAAICEGLKTDLEARNLNKPVHLLPNCVDTTAFTPITDTMDDLKQSLGIAPNAFVAGFVGSFYDFEGLDLLIQAAQDLPITLLLVGGGQKDADLRAMTQGKDNIIFTGRVPQDQVRNYYALMDVLVYPRKSMRLTNLVTPLKPLETMALGKPVIASDVGGHKELITHQHTGLLFQADSVEALKRTLSQAIKAPDLLQALSHDGRRYVEGYRAWSRYPHEINNHNFYKMHKIHK